MLLKSIVFFFLSLPALAFAQTQLYHEDFSGQNNFGAQGQLTGSPSINLGTATWTIDVSQANLTATSDWFVVRNEKLEGRDLDGEAIWYSPSITINGFNGIEILIDAEESGTLESSDYLIAEYRLDAGAWVNLRLNGSLYDDFNGVSISHFGFTGQTLEIRVRMLNNASTEYHSIDNVMVLGYSELLYSAGSWNRQPDAYSDSINVRIATGENLSANSNMNTRNLILEANATLILNSGQSLRVHEAIQNNGQIILENESVLVQTASTNLNSGSGSFEVKKDFVAPDHERFSFWSSPVQNATMQQTFATTWQGDRYEFNAENQSFQAYPNGILTPGLAYACAPSAQNSSNVTNFSDQRIFSGNLNNGPLSVSLNNIQGGDWLLLGNPYPSPIDFQVWIQANPDIVPSLYFWDSSTPSKSGSAYAIWNSAGGVAVPFSTRNAPTESIAVGQGFMVQIDPSFSGSSLNIQFDNNQRQSTFPSFFKSKVAIPRFYLSLGNDSIGLSTLIALAVNGKVPRNAQQKESFSGIEFFTKSGESPCAIQTLAYDGPAQTLRIKLGIKVPDAGMYRLSLDSIQNAAGYNYSLFNRKDSTFYNLNLGPKSLFLASGELDSSYEFHIYPAQLSLDAKDSKPTSTLVTWTIKDGRIILNSCSDSFKMKDVTLYSLGGRQICHFTNRQGFASHALCSSLHDGRGYALAEVHFVDGSTEVLLIPIFNDH